MPPGFSVTVLCVGERYKKERESPSSEQLPSPLQDIQILFHKTVFYSLSAIKYKGTFLDKVY